LELYKQATNTAFPTAKAVIFDEGTAAILQNELKNATQ